MENLASLGEDAQKSRTYSLIKPVSFTRRMLALLVSEHYASSRSVLVTGKYLSVVGDESRPSVVYRTLCPPYHLNGAVLLPSFKSSSDNLQSPVVSAIQE